jgi:hypothetical protein
MLPFGLGDKAQEGAFDFADALKRKEEELPQATDTTGKVLQGVGAFLPGIFTAGAGAAGSSGQDAIDRGASLPNAEAHAGLGGVESLVGLLTGKLGSGVLSRALLQGTAGGAAQEVGRRAGNALSPDDQQQPFDPVALGLAVGGGAAGAAFPHENPTAPSVESLKATETATPENPPPTPAANLKTLLDDVAQTLRNADQPPPAPNPVTPAAPPVQEGRAATPKPISDIAKPKSEIPEATNGPVADAVPAVRAGNSGADRSANGTGVDAAPSPVESCRPGGAACG